MHLRLTVNTFDSGTWLLMDTFEPVGKEYRPCGGPFLLGFKYVSPGLGLYDEGPWSLKNMNLYKL